MLGGYSACHSLCGDRLVGKCVGTTAEAWSVLLATKAQFSQQSQEISVEAALRRVTKEEGPAAVQFLRDAISRPAITPKEAKCTRRRFRREATMRRGDAWTVPVAV